MHHARLVPVRGHLLPPTTNDSALAERDVGNVPHLAGRSVVGELHDDVGGSLREFQQLSAVQRARWAGGNSGRKGATSCLSRRQYSDR